MMEEKSGSHTVVNVPKVVYVSAAGMAWVLYLAYSKTLAMLGIILELSLESYM